MQSAYMFVYRSYTQWLSKDLHALLYRNIFYRHIKYYSFFIILMILGEQIADQISQFSYSFLQGRDYTLNR